ncbi:RING finger domain protein [Sporothrix schenckii 1099-18]|uniref:RING finger domain protein n=1 Tax=Sporothrix schenckii 1099-18 TaxID=1397361 RepID=A0A0F2M4I5_SPOSC|nr:RING finger domain protein [Sporothrix schenckii 1099-18]KJR84623.1 RING finger domain protein [Sporothrix schenckii 1099-18]
MSVPQANLGKSLSSPSPSSHSPVTPAAASTGGADYSSRRPNQQTSGPAAGISAAPRKGQASRKQHRNQKRPGAASGGASGSGNTGQNKNKNYRFEDEDDMAETRALKNASSRRGQTSITHLLNYAAPSRAHLDHAFGGNDHYYGSRSRHHGGHHHYAGGGHHSYRSHHHNSSVDKARFVHSNYRFVVSPKGNYATQATDADGYIDWSDVLQVLASTESQSSSCPICLSEPVAPRMAKCGHIFCLPCLIRFMHAIDADDSASNASRTARTVVGLPPVPDANGALASPSAPVPEKRAKWKKCPICEESVYLGEVRPVRFYAGQESPLPRPGDDVVLRLMMRHANSTVALPRESAADVLNSGAKGGRGGVSIPWHFAANVLDYARIMKGTGDYMVEEFGRELEDLARQEKEDELLFHEDGEWTRRAMRAVRTAQESSRELGGIELALQDGSIFGGSSSNQRPMKQLPVGAEPASPTVATASPAPARAAQPRPDDGLSSLPRPTAASSGAAAAAGAAATVATPQDFYFYMSPPHLYLSPLDIRILKTKYGSFSAFPSTLLPRVEHISTGHVVDDAMRRRAKYLGHLPAGCVVSFLECDWTDIVPAETLATFAEDIERRRKRNRDKAFQEERERLQAERLEAAALHRGAGRRGGIGGGGGSGDAHGGLDGGDHGHDSVYDDAVRPMDINEFQPLGGGPGDSEGGGLTSSSASPPNPRLGFGQLASMSTTPPSSSSNSASRTVWGTRAVPVSPSLQAYVASNAPDDGWLKDDQVLGSLLDTSGASDADLVAQMEALGVEAAKQTVDGDAAAAASPAAGGKSKKKKKQKITLMSTGGRRGF